MIKNKQNFWCKLFGHNYEFEKSTISILTDYYAKFTEKYICKKCKKEIVTSEVAYL